MWVWHNHPGLNLRAANHKSPISSLRRCLFANIRTELTGRGVRNSPHTPSPRLALKRSGKDDFKFFIGGKFFFQFFFLDAFALLSKSRAISIQ